MYKYLSLLLILLFSAMCVAQDEQVKFVTYNILNYPSSNASDNTARANAFRDIMEEIEADAIVLQELKSSSGANQLLAALNTNTLGITYARAPIYNSYAGLGNMLFYNTAKLDFVSQTDVPQINFDVVGSFNNANPRPPTHYRMYALDPLLSTHLDTVFLDFFSTHLKAGTSSASGNVISDRDRRVNGAEDLIDYIATLPADRNVVVGGDFNFYDDDFATDTDNNGIIEPGYGELVNNGLVDVIGGWNRQTSGSVGSFTQSTRTNTSDNGLTNTNGGATNGLDDRFDFIFMDNNVVNNANSVAYVTNSYDEFGTPNTTFSSALSGSSPVKNELHLMSDHYPIVVELELYYPLSCPNKPVITAVNTNCLSGSNSGEITINANVVNNNPLEYSIDGTNYQPTNVFSNLSNGVYTVYVRDQVTDCSVQQLNVTVACSTVCTIDQITVTPICTGTNDDYTIDIIFNALNLSNTLVNVTIAGTIYGPYAVSGSGPTYSLSIPAIDFTGDASNLQTNVMVEVSDPNAASSTSVVLINEVLANADGGSTATDNGTGEFVELFCAGPGPCDLSCYLVGDDDYAFLIPNGTIISAGDFYVLHGDNLSNGNGGPVPSGTQFFNWNDAANAANIFSLSGASSVGGFTNGSEQVYLWDATGSVVDGVIWNGGSSNLGNSYPITLPIACGSANILLTQSAGVNTAANSGGGDAEPMHLNSGGTWNTSSIGPTPGSANTSQFPTDMSSGNSQCVGTAVFDEQSCAPMLQASSVNLKVFLEGAFDGAAGQMRTDLNTLNLLPMQHPYTTAPYNYTGGAVLTAIPSNMVDWVLVEARTGTTNTTTFDTQVGLLMADGTITDTDGVSPLTFNLTVGDTYYFVVRHRNHLDVMSATGTAQASNILYDFTVNTAQAFGVSQQKMIGSSAVIFAADITQDLIIQTTDYDAWRLEPAQLYVYDLLDANMDGVVQTTDYDLWNLNKAKVTPIELAY